MDLYILSPACLHGVIKHTDKFALSLSQHLSVGTEKTAEDLRIFGSPTEIRNGYLCLCANPLSVKAIASYSQSDPTWFASGAQGQMSQGYVWVLPRLTEKKLLNPILK
jgi:hypothetical protein